MLKRLLADLFDSPATRWAFALFVLTVGAYLYIRYQPPIYMTRLEPVPTPEYIERAAGSYLLGGKEHPLTTYVYALVEPFYTQGVQLPVWPHIVFGLGWLIGLSILVACISYITEKIRLYLLLGVLVCLAVLLMPDAVAGPGIQGWLLRGAVLTGWVALPYFFSQWRPWYSLAMRFGAIALVNLSWFAYLGFTPLGDAAYGVWAGYATFPMLLVTLLWVFQIAYIGPYWVLRGAVLQSANAAVVFALAILLGGGNILLGYLQGRGLFTGAIFVPDTVWLLLVLALAGIGPYKGFAESESNWFTATNHARTLWLGWAAMGFSFLGLAQGTENASLTEVVEDSTNLALIGVCIGYLFYVLVNFGVPLWRGLRADRVFFDPRQLPISAILAIAATVVLMFFLGADKFPYYQAQSGYYTAVADGQFIVKDYQGADVFYQQATDNERYGYHANYMLAQLARAKNAQGLELEYLKTATEIKGRPAGFVELAARYAADGRFFYQVDALRAGLAKYPKDEALLTDITLAFAGTHLQDSTTHYATLLKQNTRSLSATTTLSGLAAMGKLSNYRVDVGPNAWLTSPKCPANLLRADSSVLDNVPAFIALYNAAQACPSATPAPSELDTLAHLAASQGQPGFAEDLLYLKAQRLWRSGNTLSALEQITALARPGSFSKQTYYRTAFAWAIMSDNARLATQLAAEASRAGVPIPPADSAEAANQQSAGATASYPPASLPSQLPQVKNLLQNLAKARQSAKPEAIGAALTDVIEGAPYSPIMLQAVLNDGPYTASLEGAYQALVRAYQLDDANPYVVSAYIHLATRLGLQDFADQAAKRYIEETGKLPILPQYHATQ